MSFHFALGFFEIFWACFAWNIPQLLFIISLRLEKSKRFAVYLKARLQKLFLVYIEV